MYKSIILLATFLFSVLAVPSGVTAQNDTQYRLHLPISLSNTAQSAVPSNTGSTIKIHAAGRPADGIYPDMEVRINDQAVLKKRVDGTVREYSYIHSSPVSASQVKVVFTNDYNGGPGNDRDLFVDRITIGGITHETEAASTYYASNEPTYCPSRYAPAEWMTCGGSFAYAQNVTSAPSPTPSPSPTPATGKVYYVAPNGNDANPGTQTQPWRTMYKAANALRAGETAIFEDGTYVETQRTNVANNGTATAPIVFKARNKHRAKLYYRGLSDSGEKFRIDKAYVILQDFEITQDYMSTGSSWGDVLVRGWSNAAHCKIIGNKIHNAKVGIKFHGSSYCIYDGNTLQNSQIPISSFNSLGTIIRNNQVINPAVNGIEVKGGSRSVQVYNNTIRTTGSATMDIGINLGGYSCVQGCDVYDPNGYEAYKSVAYNNVVVAESRGNILIGLGLQGCDRCALFNNVVVGARYGIETRRGAGTAHGWTWAVLVNNPTFKNNIIIDATLGAANFQDIQGTRVNDYNLYFNTPNPPSEAHGVYANPLFVNKYSDWRLQAGSPAIGKGSVSSFTGFNGEPINISYDRDGSQRVAPWDIGAYEYSK
jgi:parallel beta-helix repeat protein